MPKGYVYILECCDGSYYTGSTVNIEERLSRHKDGKGANHTKKRLPVELVYLEEFQRIDDAFFREKQIQGWSRIKKEALIKNNLDKLPELSVAYRDKIKSRSGFENLSHQKTKNVSHQKTKNLSQTEFKNKTDLNDLGDLGDLGNSVSEALEGTINFRSNGKLLLTGEYAVLDGAKTLAIPTKYGQSLSTEQNASQAIVWKSYDELGEIWFKDEFKTNEILKQDLDKVGLTVQKNKSVSDRLIEILYAAHQLNPEFLNSEKGYKIETHQDFNRKWGLGTSSTLINNIANWAKVDAYKLLEKTFGGSGYDIACAQYNTPIIYQRLNSQNRIIKPVTFKPTFESQLYFVYLNEKQNSRDGIKAYKNLNKVDDSTINDINQITDDIINCETLDKFQLLMDKHEKIISGLIDQDPIKVRLFNDFNGSIKSLGAWGGDFVLVAAKSDPRTYFNSKGFETIVPYKNMILN